MDETGWEPLLASFSRWASSVGDEQSAIDAQQRRGLRVPKELCRMIATHNSAHCDFPREEHLDTIFAIETYR